MLSPPGAGSERCLAACSATRRSGGEERGVTLTTIVLRGRLKVLISPNPEGLVDRELLKGSTPLLLLSLLCEGPMYGYQIIETVRQRTGGTYTLKEGALYPALHKLEATEFIASYWETQENGRERRYYAMPYGERYIWGATAGMIRNLYGLVYES